MPNKWSRKTSDLWGELATCADAEHTLEGPLRDVDARDLDFEVHLPNALEASEGALQQEKLPFAAAHEGVVCTCGHRLCDGHLRVPAADGTAGGRVQEASL